MTVAPPRRIAVLRAGALGDFLVTLPALAWLRRRFPQAQITVYGNRAALELVAGRGVVDAGYSFDLAVPPEFFMPLQVPTGPWVAEWRDYELCIVWLRDYATVADNLRRLTGGTVLAASPLPESGPRIHVTDHCLATLAPLGLQLDRLARSERQPEIRLLETEIEAARTWLHRHWGAVLRDADMLIAVHAGSGGRWKCWPAERYAELCRRLRQEHGAALLLVEGPADAQPVGEVLAHLRAQSPLLPVIHVAGLTLQQLAGVLACCDAYVGNDSGVTHLSAALGIPVVAIFGPTDPAIWAPRGVRVSVLWRGRDIRSVTVEEVLEAATSWVRREAKR
jgi:ADP-heptose:LPS heptosyltransferase